MRPILIVGAGQAGLQLGLGLLTAGYDVTVVAARTPDEIRAGRPPSTQTMFEPALATERAIRLNLWDGDVAAGGRDRTAPAIRGFRMGLPARPGEPILDLIAPLDAPARSIDQRVKMSRWLELVRDHGGRVIYEPMTLAGLDDIAVAGSFALVVVAAGRSELVDAFAIDLDRSTDERPPRVLSAAYVHGLDPHPAGPDSYVEFYPVPGVGEMFVVPALTLTGRCAILLWETIPGGPGDRWPARGLAPGQILRLILELAGQYTPWVAERTRQVQLTDPNSALHGRFTPQVRHPVAHLPAGGLALGIGDVVTSLDPIAGQGANLAAKAASHHLTAVLAHGTRPFDESWMIETAEAFWHAHAAAACQLAHTLLQPPTPHAMQAYAAAAVDPVVARRLANGFADPNHFLGWFLHPDQAPVAGR